MPRELAKEALYTSRDYDRHHPQTAADAEWARDKSYVGQWSRAGKEGLTDEEYQEGLQKAIRLDELRNKSRFESGRKVMRELRKGSSS